MVAVSKGAARISLVVALLFLGACSSTQFFYNRLHILIPWYVDDYVELNTEQDEQLDVLLEPFLEWHRYGELPRYVASIERLEAVLDRPLTTQDIEDFWREAEQHWLRVEQAGLEWLLDLGDSLSEEQMAGFVNALWESQRDSQEKLLERDEDEYREDSYDSFKQSTQDYMGRLNREQRDRYRRAASELQRFDKLWLEEREDWFEFLEATLLERQSNWRDMLLEAIERRRESLSEAYTATYEHNLQVMYQSLVDVVNGRTEKQDRRLRKKLAALSSDLKELSAR